MIRRVVKHASRIMFFLTMSKYQLAQDITFIAAYGEGVHTFFAATVEEKTREQGLKFTIASKSGIRGILGIERYLERCARKGNVAAKLSRYLLRRHTDARTTTPGVHGIVLRSAV